MNISKLQM